MSLAVPEVLRDLLKGSPHEGAIYTFLDNVSTVLDDNKTPFFPAFTDHGSTHVERVVVSAVNLVPEAAWEHGALTDADAVAILAGCALHDFAMHLREHGFTELVSPESPFDPLPWFRERHGTMPADLPWSEEWEAFRREARHFSESQLTRILGPGHGGVPAIVVEEPLPSPSTWSENDRLVVGEFLRRHHARLSHEIAMYGLPGAGDNFTVLRKVLPILADVCGAVARSHNLGLRQAADYVEYVSPGNMRPSGVAATYVMALLRIADYLQLDADRAPTLLLRLRQPQSQVSIDEWNKHGAMASISRSHRDRSALYFEVSADHKLRTHLQLVDLIDGLQRELDAAVAVLDEAYTQDEYKYLRLACQRVYSNLHEPSLHDRLPYVPRHAALRSAEDLFRLVVGDLYGHEPAVAGRELVQNAADAVRERARWEATHGKCPLPLLVKGADVLVELRELPDDRAALVVTDNGVGMTPETVIDYFLQAGASLRPSTEELAEATPEERVEWMRAGRFGVGAFAAFLLGPEIIVRTRHVGSDRGVTFRARMDGDLVQVDWADLPFAGTEITVPFTPPAHGQHNLTRWLEHLLGLIASYYVLRQPVARFQVVAGHEINVSQPKQFPGPRSELPDNWRRIVFSGFDDVQWCAKYGQSSESHTVGRVCHNGIALHSTRSNFNSSPYKFSERETAELVRPPGLSVFDSRHLLGVSLHRFGLARERVPFEDALVRSIGRDVVALALAAMQRHPLGKGWGLQPAYRRDGWLPMLPDLVRRHLDARLLVVWIPSDWMTRALKGRIEEDLASIGWSDAPTRILLPVARDRIYGGQLDASTIRTALNGFAEATGAKHVCTVAAYPRGRRLPVVTVHEGRTTYTIDSTTIGNEAVVLDKVWLEVLQFDRELRCAVSFFDLQLDAEAPVSPLAEAWESLIGGFLPRTEEERNRVADKVYAKDADMRELVQKWARLTASGSTR